MSDAAIRGSIAQMKDLQHHQRPLAVSAQSSLQLQALHAMLERELWQRLPVEPGSLPSLVHVLEGGGSSNQGGDPSFATSFHFDTNSFPAWVAHGNPWRKQSPGKFPSIPVSSVDVISYVQPRS